MDYGRQMEVLARFKCFSQFYRTFKLNLRFISVLIALVLFWYLMTDFETYLFRSHTFSRSASSNQIAQKEQLPRILCYILISPTNLKAAKVIQKTWGSKCDHLIFYANFKNSQRMIGLNVTYLNTKEGYPYLWSKTKGALKHLYRNYYEEYCWFLKADDDTFVILENLREFVTKLDCNKAQWTGFKLRSSRAKQGYMSGGAGYLFSKEALKQVVLLLQEDTSKSTSPLIIKSKEKKTASRYEENSCDINGTIGYEDLELGKCFKKAGVQDISSIDSKGRHKFLPLPLHTLLNHEISSFHWLRHQAWNEMKFGRFCCSPNLITMHKIKPEEMETLYFLFYSIYRKIQNQEVNLQLRD